MIYDSVTAGRMFLELTCQLYQTVIYGKVPVPPTESLHGPMIFFTGLLPRSKSMQMPSELPSLIPTNRPLCDYPNHYIAPSPAINDRTNDTPFEPAPPCLQNPVLIRHSFPAVQLVGSIDRSRIQAPRGCLSRTTPCYRQRPRERQITEDAAARCTIAQEVRWGASSDVQGCCIAECQRFVVGRAKPTRAMHRKAEMLR